jgi:ABC-2 type transport system permease protein
LTRDLSYLVSPALTAVLAGGVLVLIGERLVALSGRGGRA